MALFFTFGLDNPHRFAINKQHIIRWPHFGLIFTNGKAQPGCPVEFGLIHNHPPGQLKLLVDIIAG